MGQEPSLGQANAKGLIADHPVSVYSTRPIILLPPNFKSTLEVEQEIGYCTPNDAEPHQETSACLDHLFSFGAICIYVLIHVKMRSRVGLDWLIVALNSERVKIAPDF